MSSRKRPLLVDFEKIKIHKRQETISQNSETRNVLAYPETQNVLAYPEIAPTSFLDRALIYIPEAISSQIAAETQSAKFLEIASMSTMVMYGKTIPIKAREQVSYGAYSHFTGSNPKLVQPPFPALQELMDICNAHMHQNYPETQEYTLNAVVVIRYMNGLKYIGHHGDGTATLYPDSPIYSCSFLTDRIFEVAEKKTKMVLTTVNIEAGQCYVMRGRFQTDLTHAVPQIKPKSAALRVPARINVTLRCVNLAKAEAKIKNLSK